MLGKLLYGLLFVVLAPVLLVWWARASAATVMLPAVPYPWAGVPLIVLGVGLIAGGMSALMVFGRGLPMNPYPPPVYVARGIYRFTPHPIYVGFVLCCFGASVAFESASGFWLVSPVAALALTALVMGYERHDLIRRFGADAMHTPLVSLPPDQGLAPTRWHRVSVYLLVFLPWAAAFEAVYLLGVPRDGIVGYLLFERAWPVLEWTEAIYASVYVLVLAAPLIVRTQRDLRTLAVTGLVATAVVTLIYITVPVIVPPRPFEPETLLGRGLMLERAMSHTVGAFPAFHVIWSLIAADAWATRSRAWGIGAWVWAFLITLSCITTGMHALIDIVAAALVFLVVRRYRRVWHVMRRGAEAVANSWHEWRWRRVRLINHGIYAGLAGTVGLWISGSPRRGALGPTTRGLLEALPPVWILRQRDRRRGRGDRRWVGWGRHRSRHCPRRHGSAMDPGARPVALFGAGLLSRQGGAGRRRDPVLAAALQGV
jgi:protein-S-isoprenylcysteine O-methyltransferase Ste14